MSLYISSRPPLDEKRIPGFPLIPAKRSTNHFFQVRAIRFSPPANINYTDNNRERNVRGKRSIARGKIAPSRWVPIIIPYLVDEPFGQVTGANRIKSTGGVQLTPDYPAPAFPFNDAPPLPFPQCESNPREVVEDILGTLGAAGCTLAGNIVTRSPRKICIPEWTSS